MDKEQTATMLQGIQPVTVWKCHIRVNDSPGACSATLLEFYDYF